MQLISSYTNLKTEFFYISLAENIYATPSFTRPIFEVGILTIMHDFFLYENKLNVKRAVMNARRFQAPSMQSFTLQDFDSYRKQTCDGSSCILQASRASNAKFRLPASMIRIEV